MTTKLDDLISCIKADQTKRVKTEDPMVINIFVAGENPEQSTTGMNGHFVHFLLLIDVLLRMKSTEKDRKEFIALCKNEYQGNKSELTIIKEFEKDYSPSNALWWYTRESFLYKMLNKALRVQNIDLLFLLRFFICDIHRELELIQSKSPMRVYRGQVLSKDELKSLQQSKGKLISISSFFSTTTDRDEALEFLKRSNIVDDLRGVIFEIDADPRVVTTKPFGDISARSKFPGESEVLFMVGCIFRLEDIRQNKDQTWVIRLMLCDGEKHDLKELFGHMKKTYGGDDDVADLLTFGKVLRQMGKYELAEKFYRRLLNELPSDDRILSSLYYSLGLVLKDKKELSPSLEYLNKSLAIELHKSPRSYQNICDRYNAIGDIYRRQGKHDRALYWYNKAKELLEKEKDVDGLKMAHLYNNMALILEEQKNYTKALDLNQKALVIRGKCLPPNHSDIGVSHNNIGNIYYRLRRYDLALEHYNQSLNIKLKSLPSNHPHVAQNYANMATVHEDKDELNQALTFYQKAASIFRQSLVPEHPDLVRAEKDVKRIFSKMKR